MRSRQLDAPLFAGARFGIDRGLVGIGEPLELDPVGLEEALELTAVAHGPKAVRMLRRFAELPPGAFVWTRVDEGDYRLGRITGPWQWERSPAARETGIHNVRATDWLPDAYDPGQVPPAVAATFARGGRNLQRINDRDAERQTERLAS
jgi:hypothetical protein